MIIYPDKTEVPNIFTTKLDSNLAKVWMTYTQDGDPLKYKRCIHVSNGPIYFGCFPINIEPIENNSKEVLVIISYDGFYNILPDVITVKEIH